MNRTFKNIIFLLPFLLVFPSILLGRPLYTSSEYNELYYDRYASNLYNHHLNRKYTEKTMEMDNRVAELESRLAEGQKRIETLMEEKTNLEANSAKALSDCQNEYRKVASELEALKQKKLEDDRLWALRVEDLEKQIATIREKADNREQALMDEMKQSEQRYLAEIDRLKKELEDTRKKAAKDRESLLAAQEKTVNDLNRRIGELEKTVVSLQAENQRLQDELEKERKISRERQKQLDKLTEQQRSLEEKLASEIEKGEIRLKRFRDRLVINMDNKILFDSGSADLRSNQIRSTLDEIGKILASYPESRIVVEGHTDDVPIRTSRFRDNWQLSTERALAVLARILKNEELNPSRFSAAGAAEFRPLVPNTSEQNRALNRRVDIVVYPETAER